MRLRSPPSRGLRVHEANKPKGSTGGAASVLSVLVKTQTEEHMVKGAVLHQNTPRLLHVDGIEVEAPLERNLIYLRNRDVPGVIGKVGSILGDHKINIADFSLGPPQRRVDAGSSAGGDCGGPYRRDRAGSGVGEAQEGAGHPASQGDSAVLKRAPDARARIHR